MNLRLTLRLLGGLLVFLAAALLLPLLFAFGEGGGALAFVVSAAAAGGTGMMLLLACPAGGDIGVREGFGIVTFGWLAYSLFGALPFLLTSPLTTSLMVPSPPPAIILFAPSARASLTSRRFSFLFQATRTLSLTPFCLT